MLSRAFELIPIEFGFFKLLLNLTKDPTGSFVKFHQKCQGENSPFL